MSKRKTKRRSTSSQHKLDIVIPVYGRPELLQECLRSVEIAALDVDYQLIIVDDSSPDVAAMNVIYDGLNSSTKIAKNQENNGFPRTANRGVEMGNSPSILILNSDVTLTAGSIRTMLDTLYSDTPKGPITPGTDAQTGIVAPKLLFPLTPNISPGAQGKIQHAGLAINACRAG